MANHDRYGHNYGYGYGYSPPPPPADPLYPTLRPSNSFPAQYDTPPPRPTYHSGPLTYPPPESSSFFFPSPIADSSLPQPCRPPIPAYSSSTGNHPSSSTLPHPPPLPHHHIYPSPSFEYDGSFHHQPYSNHSGELTFPPPHSDDFVAAYGGYQQPSTSSIGPPAYPHGSNTSSSHAPGPPVASSTSSAFVPYPTLQLESMLNDTHLSDPMPPVSHSPSFQHHQGPAEMYAFPNNSSSQFHGGDTQIVPFLPPGKSLKVLLLHGNLDVWVYEAKNLPNLDTFSKTLSDLVGKRLIDSLNGKIEGNRFQNITSDPYVSISLTTAVIGRTYVISNDENPVWNQHFYLPVAHYAAEVQFTVKDNDFVGSELIGTVTIPVNQIYGGERVEGTYSVLGTNGKECKRGATLRLSIQYIPVEMQSMYHQGVLPGHQYGGVPGTYFPLRTNCKVKLYQDAHVPDGFLPEFKLDHGLRYEHGKCWRDICEAISEAQRLIYITGWSVYHRVRLVRDAIHGSDDTLGELLKSKSQQGVRVLLLVWDDPTSRTILGYNREGFMATHDEETRRFFKHSSVHVLLCPRSAGKRHSWVKKQEVGIIYTHHQKTVIVDSEAGNNYRKIIAFVGGLDLCDGRYDTPKHPLFSTLQTLHKDDIHNPTFTGTDTGGPREPWHDLHSRIDGPAAYDVLKNFEERWLKASKPHGMKKLKKPYDDKLLNIEKIPTIIGMEQLSHSPYYDPETWDVQIFRSIDSNSVKGFPKDPKYASDKNLVCGKNVLIDTSIHTAYVKAIRAAQHFIYIENQYFLGSSYNWASHEDLGANNLIPMEIALKIARKIKSNERFSAYIVIPMWPEGNPTGVATQRILYWQNKTMEMMYEVIYKALVEAGNENKYEPQDYLNFFCLGNREALEGNSLRPSSTAENASNTRILAQKARRFMIYVHSKGMIVDDEYIIVGSANINERSLAGSRDTEIAMGSYQPQHTWAKKGSSPRGQIHAYRMSLWAEHTGVVEDCFTDPGSLDCMRRMRALGEFYRRQFISDVVTEMRGHLLAYPVDVDRTGRVKPLQNWETFPDVGGNVCGSFSAVQENLTI